VLEQHPAVRQALEQELASVEQSRAAYAQSAKQAAQLSAAAIFSQWPELASLTKDRERLGRLVRPDRPAAW
jgi:hypothetical protein